VGRQAGGAARQRGVAVVTERRCAACGATNPASASWCSQCYERFDDDRAAPGPSAAPPAQAQRPRRAVSQLASSSSTPSEGSGFCRVGDELHWECVGCGTASPMDVDPCPVCGTAFSARFAEPEAASDLERLRSARRAGRLLPGLGHVRLGQAASGIARITLFAVWLVGALALLSGGTVGLLAATPLAIGAGTVYVASDVDVGRLERREPQLLQGRALLWLVMGVTVLASVGMGAAAIVGARGAS